ncbi:MAG: CDP-alcohol phosphatidyltransferase family protein [Clostridia bacterium]|nr:CDP-alcohol phosphatidyltransferase family protein [Clostridia bacterium]
MKETIKDLFSNWKTVPNLLSFLRIVMVPIFAVLYVKGMYGWAVLVLALSGISDFLDGKIARRFNQISSLGKILDPLADKATQITIAILFFWTFTKANQPIVKAAGWIFLVFLVKEAVMVIGSVIMIIIGLRPGAAEMPGKIATFAFYFIMVAIVAFGPEIGIIAPIIPGWLMLALVIISAVLTIVAFCGYIPGVIEQLKAKKAGNLEEVIAAQQNNGMRKKTK